MRAICILLLLPAAALAADPVPYPEGYRAWTHVKSMVIEKGHPLDEAFGRIHHLYANKQAMQGYRRQVPRRLGNRVRPARPRAAAARCRKARARWSV